MFEMINGIPFGWWAEGHTRGMMRHPGSDLGKGCGDWRDIGHKNSSNLYSFLSNHNL
jgi:hypothetical protein